MPDEVRDIGPVRVLVCGLEGPILGRSQDASDLIGSARSQSAAMVALPMSRLDPAFFQLRTGLAGDFLQKFVNYGVRLAILGDFAALAAQSVPVRDLIRESNRGRDVWFLADFAELESRLKT